ncbi:hypothetical protein BofuT4_uP030830.1 [Botrytis cinerea T4]|uniref:Uncharacterized protein n=1 Tax=Botryotinia fuckeliana (strain T4) TaxID=999810 RepID=G2Y9D1_BOTF4|nr:hypothetical protein BofuT4_uP030830.1 [Botrytis cinerea T4]
MRAVCDLQLEPSTQFNASSSVEIFPPSKPFVPLALNPSYQRTQIEPSNDQTVFHQNHQLCPKLPKVKVVSPLKSGYNRE